LKLSELVQYWREITLGCAAGLLGFALLRGYMTQILPFLLIGGLLLFLVHFRQSNGGTAGKIGISDSASDDISFCDIGGQDRAINELRESLNLLVGDDEAMALGVRPLRGLLLVGPPGTGKTMMARAAANYTNSSFVATSGSEFVEMYAGVGAQRVREIFKKARKKAEKEGSEAAIVFIDELEIIGGKRGRNSSHLEYDQTLNQLLVAMDGMQRDDSPRVLVVGATNRKDLLDDALLRPGRFDRVVQVEYPDLEGRQQILSIHLHNKPVADDVDLEVLGKETFGFSGAHLESLCNEAAIMAFREGNEKIQEKHFLESVEKVIMGEKIDKKPSKRQLQRVAIHEVGHALIGEITSPGTVAAVSITPRGGSLGYVRKSSDEDRYLHTENELSKEIAFSLGGCAAERVMLGENSTGVSGDFARASQLAQKLVFSGMSRAGIVSEETMPTGELDSLVSDILNKKLQTVMHTVEQNAYVFDQVVPQLLKHERLSGDTLRQILGVDEESQIAASEV